MKGMLSRMMAVCLLNVAFTACSEDAPSQDLALDTRSSFLEDYIAAQDLPPSAEAIDVTGTWSGLLYCAGRDFPIDISIDASGETINAVVSISPMIGKETLKTPFYRAHVNVPMEISYASGTHILDLIEPYEPEVTPRADRRLSMRALIDPKTKNQALLYIAEVQGTQVRRSCDFGIVGKEEGAQPIVFMAQVMDGLYGSRRPIELELACPPAYKAWLDMALALPQPNRMPVYGDALKDKVFIPGFGKAYKDMSADALLSAGQLLMGTCRQSGRSKAEVKRDTLQILRAASYLSDHRYYQSVRHTQLRSAVAANWTQWMEGEVERGAPVDLLALSIAANAPRIFALNALDIGADNDFTKRLLSYADTLKDGNRMLQFVRSIEDVRDDFKALLAKHQIAEQREDLDDQVSAQALDRYLLPAAQTLSTNMQSLRDIVYMASWSDQVRQSGACPAASDTLCSEAANIFDKASSKAVKRFAKTLKGEVDSYYPKKASLEDLASFIKREERLRRQYGILFTSDAFEDIRETFEDKRRALQKRQRSTLVEMAERKTTAPELNAIKSAYFLDDDLEQSALKKVATTLQDQLEKTSPFYDVYAADYFNALFNQDFATLQRLDAYYLERMRPLMDFGTQQIVVMGPLLDAITGSPQGTAAGDVQRGVANLSALYAIMGTYLIDYQDVYKACLERNAVTFRITRRTEMVTTDGFGNEIKRTPGWTTADDYTINREFRQNFQSLFGTASGTGTEQLFDMFLNDGRVTQMRSGMSKLMRTYDCKSRDVQQLEDGMIAYDRDVTRRMRGR